MPGVPGGRIRQPERCLSKKVSLVEFFEQRGSTDLLAQAARLADRLEHLDFFIRPLNIQDPGDQRGTTTT